MPRTYRLRRRRTRSIATRLAATALAALAFGASYVAADAIAPPLHSTSNHASGAGLPALNSGSSFGLSGAETLLNQHDVASTENAASDSLDRRKHVIFQDLDQLQVSSNLDRSQSRILGLDRLALKSPVALEFDDAASADREAVTHDADSESLGSVPSVPDARLFPVSGTRQYKAKQPADRFKVTYSKDLVGQDLKGKQTGNGYVFSRHANADLSISDAGAALVNLFSRRDSPVSRPPLVPNSNSRLLIGLVVVCIIAVGIVTVAIQEMWNRLQAGLQPRSPLRRRSGEARSIRTLHRSDGSYSSLHTNALTIPSLEEEEERIKTPPTLSRRSSAAATASSTPYTLNGSSDSDDDEVERKTSNDLHYLSLPFGIGIGYSYVNIADGGDAQSRISRLAAKRSRRRSGSTLALSTGALPIAGTGGVNGADGLRSRSRSFKELCRDAFGTTTSRDIGMISEEEVDGEMSTVSTPSNEHCARGPGIARFDDTIGERTLLRRRERRFRFGSHADRSGIRNARTGDIGSGRHHAACIDARSDAFSGGASSASGASAPRREIRDRQEGWQRYTDERKASLRTRDVMNVAMSSKIG
ncbi:lysophospholipase [Pseudozyma hubeiensis SY62]|uniref:Lysophospholipase n=1 Tax=Pseudozyma hubeiensis (strain SY62) TaxID=1305764 RepID=R9P4R4_PSEHS|nr:lysophospholipase [Pseudozyma hubeiensis SY62]GAC93105.1 lysophospholipase [Pseudozyma hubeiensis SY62]